jgi:hypothetical protein
VEKAFSSFNGLEIFFLICAVTGGFFVVFKLITLFLGGDTGSDIGMDGGGDVDIDMHHADSDVGFKFLSVHGFSAFLMMFGLVGLALYRQSGAGMFFSIAGAVLAGLGAVWVIGKLFQGAGRLQSSGTLDISVAVGCTGTVYLSIPEGGVGRVSLNVKNHLREYDAAEVNKAEVRTGTPVRVVGVNANVLTVEIIK